jgi:hypothetical protein
VKHPPNKGFVREAQPGQRAGPLKPKKLRESRRSWVQIPAGPHNIILNIFGFNILK